ncbi:hypothetical protein C8Q73DRAFT_696199 [Cubamyces lactineus]|nr:hypothetical protein C8Q73DRAFT_696199 [Cubamyces lactineus]
MPTTYAVCSSGSRRHLGKLICTWLSGVGSRAPGLLASQHLDTPPRHRVRDCPCRSCDRPAVTRLRERPGHDDTPCTMIFLGSGSIFLAVSLRLGTGLMHAVRRGPGR